MRLLALHSVPGTMALSVASTSTFLKGGALRRASATPAQARRLPNRCGALCQLFGKVSSHGGTSEWRQDSYLGEHGITREDPMPDFVCSRAQAGCDGAGQVRQ